MANDLANSHVSFYENLGRTIFNNYLIASNASSINFSSNPYAGTDLEYTTSRNYNAIGEIKYRKVEAGHYPDWMIEKKKYDELKDNYINQNKIPVYITISCNDYLFIQDLRDLINNDLLTFSEKLLPKNDFELHTYVNKVVSYIPYSANTLIYKIEDSTKFNKVNHSDIKYIEVCKLKKANEQMNQFSHLLKSKC
jgi:hypothetical protein